MAKTNGVNKASDAGKPAEDIQTIENPEKQAETGGNSQEDGVFRSIRDIVRDLSKPVAWRHLRTRKQGGKELTYISWYDAIKYLDHYAPGWFYEISSINNIAGKLILVVRISIPCAEGLCFREATGQEDETTNSFGDSSSNAESMALRRAAAKFGLGLYLYDS